MRRIIVPVLLVFAIIGCENAEDEILKGVEESEVQKEDDGGGRTERIENIVYNIPSPTETVSILQRAGAKYVFDFPNDPMKADDYESLSKKGLNMGVYGADLTYASVFNKSTETSFYLSCVSKLGRKLGVEQVFNEDVKNRIQDNIDNRDSMQVIVNETFWELDAYLKEQGRDNISALVIVGGWIESLYLATQFVRMTPDNEELKQRIAEQKYSLDNLIGLVKTYQNKAGLDEVMGNLEELKELFDQIKEVKEPNTEPGMIGQKIKLEMSDELLNEIIDKVEEIRTEIVS